MDEGGVPIQVLATRSVFMLMRMLVVTVTVTVVMLIPQQPGGQQIHQQADHGDHQSCIETDRDRRPEPRQRFADHEQRHDNQQQGAGETGQHLDLPGSERETLVRRVAPSQQIRQRRQADGYHVRGHMPAVRQQRHGVEPVTGDDLHQHGQAGQNDHRPGLTLGVALQRTVVVRWLPLRMIAARHTNSLIDAFQLVPCHAGKVNRCLWPP